MVVVTPYTNTRDFKVRKRLYDQFAAYIKQCGLDLYTVEMVLGNGNFEVTEPNNPFHLQIYGTQEFWFKENLQNLMAARLPKDVDKIAFIDCDCMFVNTNWVQETIRQLDHYQVVQLWSHYIDVGPDHQPLRQPIHSFAYMYNNGGTSFKYSK